MPSSIRSRSLRLLLAGVTVVAALLIAHRIWIPDGALFWALKDPGVAGVLAEESLAEPLRRALPRTPIYVLSEGALPPSRPELLAGRNAALIVSSDEAVADWQVHFAEAGVKPLKLSIGPYRVLVVAPSSLNRAQFSADLKAEVRTLELGLGELGELRVQVRNTGRFTWRPESIRVSYHLEGEAGAGSLFDGERGYLPKAVRPGETLQLDLPVRAPLAAGRYRLQLDVVEEGLTWFSQRGNPPGPSVDLVVSDLLAQPPPSSCLTLEGQRFAWRVDGHRDVDALAHLIHRTLDRNLVSFESDAGTIVGFSAGGGYPELWIRDSATVLPVARFRDGAPALTSWIKAHLRAQAADGELQDWIRADGVSDKNTVATDQEASLVHAAFTATRALGPGWLSEPVGDRTVLERLEAALSWVFAHRRDSNTGLVTTAHTIDWGDVGPELADQRAIDRTEANQEVVGIYAAAMFHRASTQLAALLRLAGRNERAADWNRRADEIATAARRHLWAGHHFVIHRHVGFAGHGAGGDAGFDEEAMFAMGGNVEAIHAGFTRDEETAAIFAEVRAAKLDAGLETIGGVLVPPYSAGVFRHPAVDEPWEYQNGGEWDWFAGRLLRELFRHGQPDALRELDVIAARARRHVGLWEWTDRSGQPRGSAQYAGSAAALGTGIIEGLFGVEWDAARLELTPRLGETGGCVYLPQPSTGEAMAYDYSWDRGQAALNLSLDMRAEELLITIPATPKTSSARLVVNGKAVATMRTAAGWSARVMGPPREERR